MVSCPAFQLMGCFPYLAAQMSVQLHVPTTFLPMGFTFLPPSHPAEVFLCSGY